MYVYDLTIREAQKTEGSKIERRQQLVDVVTGVVVELIQTLTPTIMRESKGKEKGKNKITAAGHQASFRCPLTLALTPPAHAQNNTTRGVHRVWWPLYWHAWTKGTACG
jgi:hypothetical protein